MRRPHLPVIAVAAALALGGTAFYLGRITSAGTNAAAPAAHGASAAAAPT